MTTIDLLDDDGYPTEELLDYLAACPIENNADIDSLMALVIRAWHWPQYVTSAPGGKFALVTGGWSGNESIIAALRENAIFWTLAWESSNRGGRHEFCAHRFAEPQPNNPRKVGLPEEDV